MSDLTMPELAQVSTSLKNAAGLSNDFEYAGIWTGQSNSLPWGLPEEAYALQFALELRQHASGIDLAAVVIPNNPARAVGITEFIVAGAEVVAEFWNTSTFLRLGTQTEPEPGYAQVLNSFSTALMVRWISLPTNDTTVPGYLVRENGKFASYENVRALTPYLPWQDIAPPAVGFFVTTWTTPKHSFYPVPNGPVSANGKRLTLPAPYTLPAAVTVFDDLAVFLPMTRREGADGFGISDIADSTFTGVGEPIGHPIVQIAAGVWTFANTLSDPSVDGADFTNAYLLVDWEDVGAASKRSWNRILSNTTSTFRPDPAGWLGDGSPPDFTGVAVEFDDATDEVVRGSIATPVAHGLVEGDRVSFYFSGGGSAPAGVDMQRVYYVRNPTTDRYQISVSMEHPVIDIGVGGTQNFMARSWVYTVWIPHWKDNPFMWIPGPEFAYPNEDHQPRNVFVHFRARGQYLWGYNNQNGGAIPLGTLPFDGISDSRFGPLLPFAWRLGAAIGKRMNMVMLGIGSTPISTGHTINTAAGVFTGTVGWWNYERFGYSLPLENSESYMALRLKRLITFMAPQALLAEGNENPLRYLSACHVQGEADGFSVAGRELYLATITDYKQWLRDLVDDMGANPFSSEAQMPFAQPLISHIPYEVDPSGVITWTDTEGFINNAIRESHTADEFAGWVDSDDLPKINGGHYSGGGMVVLGARLAARIMDILDHALAYTSLVLSVNPRLLKIANLALTYVGQGSRLIESLDENTAEAKLVKIMLPEATRQLLSMRQWSWTMRQEPAAQVKHNNPRWLYAYVVPARSMATIAIEPPVEPGVDGMARTLVPASQIPSHELLARETALATHPHAFAIERSPSGHQLLFSNVAEIPGDNATQIPIPSNELFPERLPKRATIRYVDKVVDPDRYSSSFTSALSWLLASMLAPSLVKGEQGEAVAVQFLRKAAGFVRVEAAHETVTQQHEVEHLPTWIGGR